MAHGAAGDWVMSEYGLHSFVVACDFRVDDVDRMWNWLRQQADGLASIGAHYAVLYTSVWEPGRILVTIGIRHAQSIRDVLRSPSLFEWFDVSGADDIPPIFVGEVIEKIDVFDTPDDERVVIGVMSSVQDVPALMVRVHEALERFKRGGVSKVWVYRALDDGQEVMVLQEIDDEISARKWIEHPDAAAEWRANAGQGAYPKHFVGRLAHIMALDEQT
jgi:hypothetical protein